MDNKAMYKISYGLFLLSATDGKKDNGCITNTVQQITTTPNRITVCVNKLNYTHEIIEKTGIFNVSTLITETPFEIFKNFGYQSGRIIDKFATCDCKERSDNGLIYASQYSNSFISAKIFTTVDVGTHTMFVADVTDGAVISDKPSVTYEYYLKNIKPAPTETKITKGYRCKICGYIYEGEPLPPDFICPVCKHGAADFEKL